MNAWRMVDWVHVHKSAITQLDPLYVVVRLVSLHLEMTVLVRTYLIQSTSLDG